MKKFRVWSGMMIVLLCLTSGLVFAQDVPEPITVRPPMVDCTGETIACSVSVSRTGEISGIWRGYIDAGSAMGFIVIDKDGNFGTTLDPQTKPTPSGRITFTDGLAYVASKDTGSTPAECVTPGVYVMRLIRLGDQPLALTRRPLVKDDCAERAADFSEPMLSYSGSGQELPALKDDVNALAQPLVPCPTETVDALTAYPCDVVATQITDIAGIWVQYVVPPLTGTAYFRYLEDGHWVFALSPEATAEVSTSYDDGTIKFEDALATITETGGCPPAEYYLRVIQFGQQPVALSYTALNDVCAVRLNAWTDPMLWIKGV